MMTCEDCSGQNMECATCGGSGLEPGFEIGDRILFRGENGVEIATITNYDADDWYELAIDGVDDLPSIHESLIIGRAYGPSLSLDLVDAVVAQVVAPRKPNAHAHPVFAEILNNFAKGAR